nr:immunoglobulin light chain junction region [Macaca mulatta]MOW55436.1 immunoglobulin light chain junction region [Macaca mulatta]
CLQSYKTPYTF